MRIYDIIAKKRDGNKLSEEEIKFFVNGYVDGSIADYQMSSLLMAIYLNGMDAKETTVLTDCMAKSGDMIDLSSIPGIKVDKHSTGGVGDKTTLIISPIVAACGVPVAKMSGRGLGHTGGTIDKMESIPGVKVYLDREKFFENVKKIGLSVVGQTGNLVPADKKLYALRDVTATVESIPLIASSIMSKKIAAGADCILLDVKCGSGAFMKTKEKSAELAKMMVSIGEGVGRNTIALITDMDKPLGYAIGNSLEIKEVCEVLKGDGPKDLREVCLSLAANMLFLAGKGELSECMKMACEALDSGLAYNKFKDMVVAQGGNGEFIDDTEKFKKAEIIKNVTCQKSGYINHIDTEKCGIAAMVLGAGREKKESSIDYSAGIVLKKQLGDYVNTGEVLAELHSSTPEKIQEGEKKLLEAVSVSADKPEISPAIIARITKNSTEYFVEN